MIFVVENNCFKSECNYICVPTDPNDENYCLCPDDMISLENSCVCSVSFQSCKGSELNF